MADKWIKDAIKRPGAFTKKADISYNEDFSWGDLSKVELLWRLGVPGVWDNWQVERRKEAILERSSFYTGAVSQAGFIIRLPSGNPDAEEKNLVRCKVREMSITKFMKDLNEQVKILKQQEKAGK